MSRKTSLILASILTVLLAVGAVIVAFTSSPFENQNEFNASELLEFDELTEEQVHSLKSEIAHFTVAYYRTLSLLSVEELMDIIDIASIEGLSEGIKQYYIADLRDFLLAKVFGLDSILFEGLDEDLITTISQEDLLILLEYFQQADVVSNYILFREDTSVEKRTLIHIMNILSAVMLAEIDTDGVDMVLESLFDETLNSVRVLDSNNIVEMTPGTDDEDNFSTMYVRTENGWRIVADSLFNFHGE